MWSRESYFSARVLPNIFIFSPCGLENLNSSLNILVEGLLNSRPRVWLRSCWNHRFRIPPVPPELLYCYCCCCCCWCPLLGRQIGSLDGPKLGLIPSIRSFKTSFRQHFSRRSCWERREVLKPSILMSVWRKCSKKHEKKKPLRERATGSRKRQNAPRSSQELPEPLNSPTDRY